MMATRVNDSRAIHFSAGGTMIVSTDTTARKTDSEASVRGMAARHPDCHESHFVHLRACAGSTFTQIRQ